MREQKDNEGSGNTRFDNGSCDMAHEAIELIKKRVEVEMTTNSIDRAKGAMSWKLEFFAHVNKFKNEYHEKNIA